MHADERVLELLNDYLTTELTTINVVFAGSRMCSEWGYPRLAEHLRSISLAEMRDAEDAIDRILYFEGVPNLQRLGGVRLGENPREVLDVTLAMEQEALRRLNEAVTTCVELGDQATREFFASKIEGEEHHVDWLETQLDVIGRIGEERYLAQQVRD